MRRPLTRSIGPGMALVGLGLLAMGLMELRRGPTLALGAEQADTGSGIVLDAAGNAYVAGETNSDNRSLVWAQGVITTIAGSSFYFRGEGELAIDARLGFTVGVAVDSAGNVFASDLNNNLVVKIPPDGLLSVAAGNGNRSFSGDGGPARLASLSDPSGLAVDAADNLFIADFFNNRIRKVGTDGIITTVAGNGSAGFSGDGGSAAEAMLHQPSGVAADGAGNLYIADKLNHRVRRVSPTGLIVTVAGNGTAGSAGDGGPATAAVLNRPVAVAVDGAGNLYIADLDNQRIRKVGVNGVITTLAGVGSAEYSGDGGPAGRAQLNSPEGVVVDWAGNLYIADTNNQRVRVLGPDGIIRTAAGSGVAGFSGDAGPAGSAMLSAPLRVAVDNAGNLYIADAGNHRVRKVGLDGKIRTLAGNGIANSAGNGGPATSAVLDQPVGLAVDAAGTVYVADQQEHRVRQVSPSGTIQTRVGTGEAGFSGDDGAAGAALLRTPTGLAVDSSGNLYVADSGNHCVRRVTRNGIITTVAGNGTPGFAGDGGPAGAASLFFPTGVAEDGTGNLYIADTGNHRVRKVSASGTISTVAGDGIPTFAGDGGQAVAASLLAPTGVALDSAGNLYLAEPAGQRLRKVDRTGTITTFAGNGTRGLAGDGGPAVQASFNMPFGVAADSAGNVYIADQLNSRVRRVGPEQVITTVARGGQNFPGDGGPATAAMLFDPLAVAVDATGNLYIADTGNGLVRRVLLAAPSLPPNSVVNGASFRPAAEANSAIAPGAIVAIFGTDLASDSFPRRWGIPA